MTTITGIDTHLWKDHAFTILIVCEVWVYALLLFCNKGGVQTIFVFAPFLLLLSDKDFNIKHVFLCLSLINKCQRQDMYSTEVKTFLLSIESYCYSRLVWTLRFYVLSRSALKLLHCDDSCRMGENYVILVFLQVQHVKLEAASNDCTQWI